MANTKIEWVDWIPLGCETVRPPMPMDGVQDNWAPLFYKQSKDNMDENETPPETDDNELSPQEPSEADTKPMVTQLVVNPRLQEIWDRHAEIQRMTADVSECLRIAVAEIMESYPGEETLVMKILSGESANLLQQRDGRKKK